MFFGIILQKAYTTGNTVSRTMGWARQKWILERKKLLANGLAVSRVGGVALSLRGSNVFPLGFNSTLENL
jgi:hypothetical protein